MLQKPSKTRSWSAFNTAPLVFPRKQAVNSLHDNNSKSSVSRQDARLSVPSSARTGFFSGLFSKATAVDTTSATPYIRAPTSLDCPRPSPSATDPSTIPANLTMRNISPDLYNDPAFSSDPRAHPLFVTNPDIPIDSTPPPSPTLNARSHEPEASYMPSSGQARRTPSPSPRNGLSEDNQSFHPKTSSPPLQTVYSSSSSESETASSAASTEMMTSTSFSELSTSPSSSASSLSVRKSSQSRKGLIILSPPAPSPPPPSYDEANAAPMGSPSNTSRPQTTRAVSTPNLQSQQPEPLEVPVRPSTTPVSSTTRSTGNTSGTPRRIQGLDPIDELDETNPLGHALHHGGPYEAIQTLTQNPGQVDTSQATSNSSQERARRVPRKPVNKQPFLADSVSAIPYVPFGAPLNITPGQIVPRNFQPYTQATPQATSQPNLRSQPRLHQESHLNQLPAQTQPPSQSQPQPRPHLPAVTSQPHPSISNMSYSNEPYPAGEELPEDIEDAYGGIETENYSADVSITQHESRGRHPLQPLHEQEAPNHGAADIHQTHVNGGNLDDDDDAVARALYVVALERARTTKSSVTDNSRLTFHNSEQSLSQDAYYGISSRNQFLSDGRLVQEFTAPSRINDPPPRVACRPTGHEQHFPSHTPIPRAPESLAYSYNIPPSNQMYAVPQPNQYNNGHNTLLYNAGLDPPRRSYDSPSAAAMRNLQQSGPADTQSTFDPHDPELLVQQRRYAPSVQQSMATTTASRSGPPPRHVPKNLVMPTPLQNNPIIPPSRNGQAQSQVRFQPQPHVATPQRATPPLPSRPPEPPRTQAQNVPIAADSRKVLRKRSSLNPATFNQSHAVSGPGSHSIAPDWTAPGPGYPPSRSKSESRPPASAPQKSKVPKRVLSKRK